MYRFYLYSSLLVGAPVSAQIIESLISDVTSLYGDFTSMLANTDTDDFGSPSTAEDQSTTSDDSFSFSTSITDAVTSSTDSQPSATGSSSGLPSSTSLPSSTAASTTSADAASIDGAGSKNGHVNKNLGIILGCVLGALAILLLLLLCFCIRRRRRRRYFSDYTRSKSPKRGLFGRWKKGSTYSTSRSRSPSPTGMRGVHTFEKSGGFSTHPPTYRGSDTTMSPAIVATAAGVPKRKPVPMTAGPDEKSGLDKEVFVPANQSSYTHAHPLSSHPHGRSSLGTAMAAGAGGIAAGGMAAAAIKHHNDHKYYEDTGNRPFTDPTTYTASPDPPPEAYKTAESSPAPHGTTGFAAIDGRYHPSNAPMMNQNLNNGWNSATSPLHPHMQPATSSGLPAVSNPAAFGTGAAGTYPGAHDPHGRPLSNGYHENASPVDYSKQSSSAVVPAAIGGAAAAAALARTRRNNSKSPHRRSWSARPSDSYPSSRNSVEAQRPVSMPSDIPPTPPVTERRTSGLGTSAPPAAVGSYVDENAYPSRQRRISIGGAPPIPTEPVPPLPLYTERSLIPYQSGSNINGKGAGLAGSALVGASMANTQNPQRFQSDDSSSYSTPRSSSQPRAYSAMSPVSPMENGSFTSLPRPGFPRALPANRAPTLPSNNRSSLYRPAEPTRSVPGSGLISAVSSVIDPYEHLTVQEPINPHLDLEGKSIVGDGGYPHHNIPRRKSGGEYDYSETGPFGPPSVGPPRDRSTSRTRSGMSAPPWVMQEPERLERSSSDDSAIRLSSGMPGSWGVPPPPVSRRSGDIPRHYPPRSINNDRSRRHSRSSSRSSNGKAHTQATDGGSVGRVHSRPGYGFGSGDPYDLAAMNRQDSAMTIPPMPPQPQPQRSRSNSRPSRKSMERPEDRYERLSREMDDDVDADMAPFMDLGPVYGAGHDVGRAY